MNAARRAHVGCRLPVKATGNASFKMAGVEINQRILANNNFLLLPNKNWLSILFFIFSVFFSKNTFNRCHVMIMQSLYLEEHIQFLLHTFKFLFLVNYY